MANIHNSLTKLHEQLKRWKTVYKNFNNVAEKKAFYVF